MKTRSQLSCLSLPQTIGAIGAAVLLFSSPKLAAQGVVSGDLNQWHKVSVSFEGPVLREDGSGSENPFTDYRLDVTFTHEGSKKSYLLAGFFDGDGNEAETSADGDGDVAVGPVWRVNFNPDETGLWNYRASFRQGGDVSVDLNREAGTPVPDSFHGASGSFTIEKSDKTGVDFRSPNRGKLLYTGEHALRWAGSGDRFFKVGMAHTELLLQYERFDNTPEITTKRKGKSFQLSKDFTAHLKDWNPGDPVWKGDRGKEIFGVINYLNEQGTNVHYFLPMNIAGDGAGGAFPFTGKYDKFKKDVYNYDVSKLAQWDIVFQHMMRKGILTDFVLSEQENQLWFEEVEGDHSGFARGRKLFYREMIARFGYLNAINWNMGEENGWNAPAGRDTVGALNSEQRRAFAEYFSKVLAYEDALAFHNAPSNHVKDNPVAIHSHHAGENFLNGASCQHGLNRPEAIYGKLASYRALSKTQHAKRKWVISYDEPFVNDTVENGITRERWRERGLWVAILAGCAGAELYSHQDLSLEDYRTWEDYFPDMVQAQNILFGQNIPFWEMEPAAGPDKRSKWIPDPKKIKNGLLLEKPGEIYLIYLPNGGRAELSLAGASGLYDVHWLTPRGTKGVKRGDTVKLESGTVTSVEGGGEAKVELGSAPNSPTEDWVILVRKREGTKKSE